MRTGPCVRCGRTIDWEHNLCDQCEAELEWLAEQEEQENKEEDDNATD